MCLGILSRNKDFCVARIPPCEISMGLEDSSAPTALTVAALNDLKLKTLDVQNPFLMAPCLETIQHLALNLVRTKERQQLLSTYSMG